MEDSPQPNNNQPPTDSNIIEQANNALIQLAKDLTPDLKNQIIKLSKEIITKLTYEAIKDTIKNNITNPQKLSLKKLLLGGGGGALGVRIGYGGGPVGILAGGATGLIAGLLVDKTLIFIRNFILPQNQKDYDQFLLRQLKLTEEELARANLLIVGRLNSIVKHSKSNHEKIESLKMLFDHILRNSLDTADEQAHGDIAIGFAKDIINILHDDMKATSTLADLKSTKNIQELRLELIMLIALYKTNMEKIDLQYGNIDNISFTPGRTCIIS